MAQWEDDGPWTHGTVVSRGDCIHNNRIMKISVTKTGHIITRNSKHIKTTSITGEQYLRDQLTWHMEDHLDKILKQYESLCTNNVQNIDKDRRRREETDVKNHNDTLTSIVQRHTINNTPIIVNIQESSRNHQQIGIEIRDENMNTQTHYGRISRKLDRFTYH